MDGSASTKFSVHVFHVDPHQSSRYELFLANDAVEGSFTRVVAHVNFQRVSLREAFLAQAALVRALFRVNPLVLVENDFGGEGFAAGGASERLLARVYPQMNGQRVFRVKRLAANVANVLQVLMNGHVVPQAPTAVVLFAALGALKNRPRVILAVRFDVLVEVDLVQKVLLANVARVPFPRRGMVHLVMGFVLVLVVKALAAIVAFNRELPVVVLFVEVQLRLDFVLFAALVAFEPFRRVLVQLFVPIQRPLLHDFAAYLALHHVLAIIVLVLEELLFVFKRFLAR